MSDAENPWPPSFLVVSGPQERVGEGGRGSKSDERQLDDVHNSLTKGNIDKSGEGEGLYGKGRSKGQLMLAVLHLSQSLHACLINCEEVRENSNGNVRWDR